MIYYCPDFDILLQNADKYKIIFTHTEEKRRNRRAQSFRINDEQERNGLWQVKKTAAYR